MTSAGMTTERNKPGHDDGESPAMTVEAMPRKSQKEKRRTLFACGAGLRNAPSGWNQADNRTVASS